MPTSLLSADSQFPDLEKTENSKEKFEILSNYLYMLLEQLRYTLGNLGMDNFNESEFIKIGESITEPIYIQLADDDERMNQLQITAEGLSGRISNTEGDVTALQATANGLAARISSAEGNITSLQATSDGLAAQISNAQGDITSLQATAQGLSTRVSSAEGNITTLTQTSNSLTSRVTNAEGQISVVQQTVNGLTVTDASGTTRIKGSSIDTGSLNLTGAITWSDLSTGVQGEIDDAYDLADDAYTLAKSANSTASDIDDIISDWMYVSGETTYIDGSMIAADTIIVDQLYGSEIYLYNDNGRTAGSLELTGATSTSGQKIVMCSGAIELSASYGDIFLESGDGEYLHIQASGDVVCGMADFVPNNNATWNLGNTKKYWDTVYCSTCEGTTSDQNKKNSIIYGLDAYDAMFDGLKPITYKLNSGKSGRRHMGLCAQDVEQLLEDCGISTTDCAAFIKAPQTDDDGNEIEGQYDYALRYGEFISLLIEQVQKLKTRVKALEDAA